MSGVICKRDASQLDSNTALGGGSAAGATANGAGTNSPSTGASAGSAAQTPSKAGAAGAAGAAAIDPMVSNTFNGAAGAAGMSMLDIQREPCTTEGIVRCANAGVGARQTCQGGFWIDSAPCAAGESCSPDATVATVATGATVCQPVAAACQGNAEQVICDANGAMIMCSAAGAATVLATCTSPALCQLGLAQKTCPACTMGQFMCEGVTLKACAPDQQSFVLQSECASAALCNAELGACTDAVCEADKYSCRGNDLMHCNATASASELVETCDAGLCVPGESSCRKCTAGQTKCDGAAAKSTCDAKGQTFEKASCTGNTPYCVDPGQCVECIADTQCMAQACQTARCDLARGMCVYTDAAAGTSCEPASNSGGGQCIAGHVCAQIVSIRADAHNTYVSATDLGQGWMKAYATSVGPWERFLMEPAAGLGTTVAFKSLRSNAYVTVAGHPSFDDRQQFAEDPSMWEDKDAPWLGSNSFVPTTFSLSAGLGQTTTIRVASGLSANGLLWSAEDWGSKPIRIKTSTAGGWESFTIQAAK